MNYIVNSQLKHNGKLYEEGDEVSLEDKYAKPLLEDNIIEKKGKSSSSSSDDNDENDENTPFDELDIPASAKKGLNNSDFESLEDLEEASDDELGEVKGVGKKTVESIKEQLN